MRDERRRARRPVRYDQADRFPPFCSAQRSRFDRQPAGRSADYLFAQHDRRAGRAGLAVGLVGQPNRQPRGTNNFAQRNCSAGDDNDQENIMTRTYIGLSIAAPAVALLLSAIAFSNLPPRVPIHWNIQGQADGYGSPAVAAL